MNEQLKRNLAAQLATIAANAKVEVWPFQNPDVYHFISRGEVDFGFDRQTNEQFEAVLSSLLKENGWIEKFSERYLRDALIGVVSQIIKSNATANAGALLDRLVTAYEGFCVENVVYLPLGGIQLRMDELKIGKLTLRNLTRNAASGLFSELESASAGKAWARQLSEIKRAFFGGDSLEEVVCAEYRVIAEPSRAEERAAEECSRLLELLRFAIPALYEDYLRIEIGFLWEVSETRGAVVTVRDKTPSFHASHRTTGPATPFELNLGTVPKLESIGVFRVGKILEKPSQDLGDFERKLLQAIHWFGTSVRQPDIENKFLNLLICVESLLTPKSRDPISNAISEGVAFVLGDCLQNRISLKKRMKDLYSIRSSLSHGGKKDILEVDLDDLRRIAHSLVVWSISKADEFRRHKDLLDWIEVQKLT